MNWTKEKPDQEQQEDYLPVSPLTVPDEVEYVSAQERTHLYNDGEGRSYDLGGES